MNTDSHEQKHIHVFVLLQSALLRLSVSKHEISAQLISGKNQNTYIGVRYV